VRSRVYRGNEDGIAGICDRRQKICFAVALWNGKDPILKERLFGLTGNEGNHGEDVEECYYHLDNTPKHSYTKCLYKYPNAAFPYRQLVEETRRRDQVSQNLKSRYRALQLTAVTLMCSWGMRRQMWKISWFGSRYIIASLRRRRSTSYPLFGFVIRGHGGTPTGNNH
jgi:hypothetical protein